MCIEKKEKKKKILKDAKLLSCNKKKKNQLGSGLHS